MDKVVDSVQFFQQFVEGNLDEKQFVESLSKLITALQQKKKLSDDQLKAVGKASELISDQLYNMNIELFLKFALNLSNRAVYKVFESYNSDFELVNLNVEVLSQNVLALYIIRRVYHSENLKVLLIFLNGILREQKQVEKKLVLLEIYTKILAVIDKKDIHFRDMLPLILMVINEALEKYLQYKKAKQENTLNENNQHIQTFMLNFQQWTVSFFKRIFSQLKQTAELKNNAKSQVIKGLFTINDVYSYDNVTAQVHQKPENPVLAVKHLVLLFLFDLIQGIIVIKQTLTASQLDPKILDELLLLATQMLNEVHNNKLELIENYLQTVRFSIYKEQEIVRSFPRYTLDMTYNPISIAYLINQVLYEELNEDRNIRQILSPYYKLKLLVGVMFEQKYLNQNQTKCSVQDLMTKGIVDVLQSQPSKQINTTTHFITQFHIILLRILEKAGSGISKEEQTLYLTALKNASRMFSFECYTSIVEQSIKASDNIPLLAHLINDYRNMMQGKIKDLQLEQVLKNVQVLFKQTLSKLEVGSIDSKIQLFDSLVLLLKVLILNYSLKDSEPLKVSFAKWASSLTKYEKDIQQQLDFLNNKKKEKEKELEERKAGQDDQTNKDNDLVYFQLLNQENLIQIAYYNLQDVMSRIKE